MKKSKKYIIIFAFAIMFITLFVVTYSSQTYSEGVENGDFELTEDDMEFTGLVEHSDSLEPRYVDEYHLTTESTTDNTTYLSCENNNKRCVLKNVPKYQSQGTGTGLCWAFSALNSLEGVLLNHYNQELGFTNNSTKFSQTHMGYATYQYFANNKINPYATRYWDHITDGGEYWDADAYFTNGTGPTQSTAFSLDDFKGGVLYSQNTILGVSKNYRVTESKRLTYASFSNPTAMQNKIEDTKNYLRQGYALVTGDRSFSTKCSCYKSSARSLYCPGSDYGDNCGTHASTIVGWDDNFNDFNVVNGDPTPQPGAWIIRNSHSSSNYFYISYYSAQAEYLVTKVENGFDYDNLYQLYPYNTNYEDEANKIANIYSRKSSLKNETLTEIAFNTNIGFFANNPNVTSVNIDIYYTDKISDIIAGASNYTDIFKSTNKIGSMSVTTAGFYTYKLSTPKTIEGNKYIIGLSSNYKVFSRNNNAYYNSVGGNDLFLFEPGVSFKVNPNTGLWQDQYKNSFNYEPNAIKAYTNNTNTTSPTRTKVTSISITGADGVIPGESIQLTATVSPSNAYNNLIAWTSSDNSIATVDKNGNVTGVSNGIVTITAHATDGSGITKAKQVDVSPTGVIIPVESISFSSPAVYMIVGDTYKQMPVITPSNATYQELEWRSGYSTVQVSEDGLVTALKAGSAVIEAREPHSKITGNYVVVIYEDSIPVQTITLDETNLNLIVGQTRTLNVTFAPPNATNQSLTWSSSNTSVATVNSNGKVTAVGQGTVTITARASNGKTATCQVTVTQSGSSSAPSPSSSSNANIPVTGITLDKTSLNLPVDSTYTLVSTITPSNATDKTVTWSSSNTSVATVNSNGKVTAMSAGTATITARTSNGKTATCQVTVTIPVTGITLNRTNVPLKVGETYTLIATITPSNATNKNVIWTTGNRNIATVDSNGKVTAVGTGMTIITATTQDGGKTAKCIVRVTSDTPTIILPTQVTLNTEELTMTPNTTYTLVATVLPSNATDKTVTWSSSNTNVATVDSNGVVTGKSQGIATITVKTNSGNITNTCKVTVRNRVIQVTGVEIDSETPLNIALGETVTISATVLPTDASNQALTWSVSDTEALKIMSVGRKTVTIKANKLVTNATLTVMADGNHSDSIKVNVTASSIPVKGVSLLPKTYIMNVGRTYTFTYNTTPIDATNQEVTWSSSNPSVATIDANGKITAIKEGNSIITVTTKDGGFTAKSTLYVKEGTSLKPQTSANKSTNTSIKPNSNVTANKLEILNQEVNIETGTYETIKYDSSVDSSQIIWSSSDESIAKIVSGMIVGISEGKATIRGTIKGTNITKECEVNVTKGENVVSLIKENKDIIEGEEIKLGLITNIKDEDIKSIEWITEDNRVLDVEGGVIKGLNEGDSTVLVKINDKYVTAMEVEVLTNPENLHMNVENYDLEFSQEKHEYELKIDSKEKSLNIITDKDDKVTITGNKNLKNGSTIVVNYVDEHGNPQTYTIKIIKDQNINILYYISAIIGILLVAIPILYISKKKVKSN